jgi:hypothetical protein
MKSWTLCSICEEVIYVDSDGYFFCANCDEYEIQNEFECWLDEIIQWVDTGSPIDS